MSLAYAPQPQRRPEREVRPSHIEIVTTRSQRRARPRLAYAVIAVVGILAICLGQLALSIALSDGAYTISSLSREQTTLGRDAEALTEKLEVAASTQNLAEQARRLGMVSSGAPAFLRLSDGKIIGDATAASGGSTGKNLIANALLASGGETAPVVVGKPATISPSDPAAGEGGADVATGPAPASSGTTTALPAPPAVSDGAAIPTPVTR